MRRLLLPSLLALLVLGAGQAGATRTVFQDTVGDAGNAPDLTSIVLDNDSAGNITIQISIANSAILNADSYFGLSFNTDRNRSTGPADQLGADYEWIIRGSDYSIRFYRWNGSSWQETSSGTFQGRQVDVQTFQLQVNRSDLGNTSAFDFYLTGVQLGGSVLLAKDAAPDSGAWTYSLSGLPSTPPPAAPTATVQTVRLSGLSARPTSGVFQGRIFTVSARVVTNSAAVRVTCSANVAGRRVPMVAHYSGGVASCQGIPPVGTAGRRLTGRISVTVIGASDARLFSFLVRR